MVIVLPGLLLLLFVIVEVSRAWLTLDLVTAAAREGARAGAAAKPEDTREAAMTRMSEVLGARPATRSVDCAPASCERGAVVTATVTVRFESLAPGILPESFRAMPLTDTVSMRHD